MIAGNSAIRSKRTIYLPSIMDNNTYCILQRSFEDLRGEDLVVDATYLGWRIGLRRLPSPFCDPHMGRQPPFVHRSEKRRGRRPATEVSLSELSAA